MHKQLLNEIEINFELRPDGPILVKASDNTDPIRPDMEFVRTRQGARQTIYLPGSSLKGAFRAHYEKLARSVPNKPNKPQGLNMWACDPLAKGEANSCNEYFNKKKKNDWKKAELDKISPDIYKESCFVCQLFGNTSLASHLRLNDALPLDGPENQEQNPNNHTEQRNGVAIDRLFGSVAVGPFQFEVATEGRFSTSLQVRNFTVAHLGLLGLVLRDLDKQRLLLGFGKSRGLGRVKLEYQSLVVRYPMAQLVANNLILGKFSEPANGIYGIGTLAPQLQAAYGLAQDDKVSGPYSLGPGQGETGQPGLFNSSEEAMLDGVALTITDKTEIEAFWRKCVEAWKQKVTGN